MSNAVPKPPQTAIEAAEALFTILPQEVVTALKAWALAQAPSEAERRVQRAKANREALRLRDGLLRVLRDECYPDQAATAASDAIAAALLRYAATGWRLDQRPADGPRLLLHKILVANGGATIGARQIRNVLQGVRTPLDY